MKKVHVTFQPDPAAEDISIVFSASERDADVEALMSRITDPLSGTVTVSDPRGALVILCEDDIITISVNNKKLRVTAEDGEYELKTSLQEIISVLNPLHFLRISRYEIINLAKVKRFDFSISGQLRIEMVNNSQTWASRRYISIIRNRLKQRSFKL